MHVMLGIYSEYNEDLSVWLNVAYDLPQVIPQVWMVFGRKSLDDVIPGSWYIIPLPSTRGVVIGYNPSGSSIL